MKEEGGRDKKRGMPLGNMVGVNSTAVPHTPSLYPVHHIHTLSYSE